MADTLPDQIEIRPAPPLQATVRPPGSKSITNRAILCAALADGPSLLQGALDSEDTRAMVEGWARLGVTLTPRTDDQTIHVAGCGGRITTPRADLFVGNSGTTVRFLAAAAALGPGTYRLDGVPRMRQRPIADLLDALRQLGVRAESELGNGCPPVIVGGSGSGLRGGLARIRGDISSQFLSGLLMAAPYAQQDVELAVEGPLVSRPYVDMTLAVMSAFGVQVDTPTDGRFRIAGRSIYRARQFAIEPDASAASYFWAAAAIARGHVTVRGLSRQSLQGDVQFCECLCRMGCRVDYLPDSIRITGQPLHGIDVDMNAISDTVQTLAAVALFAEGPTTIRGVAHIRHKETDRIGDLARELRRLGAQVDELADGLRITPARLQSAVLQTYGDHRMAMSLALVGLRQPGVVIQDPACTSKTYPGFFRDLDTVTRQQTMP